LNDVAVISREPCHPKASAEGRELGYSDWSAVLGSSPAARNAGTQFATIATKRHDGHDPEHHDVMWRLIEQQRSDRIARRPRDHAADRDASANLTLSITTSEPSHLQGVRALRKLSQKSRTH
jgi:hypothetical protein